MKIVGEIPYADLVLNTNDEFYLLNRATHVIQEAQRVFEFKELCDRRDDLVELGQLMKDSQTSCRNLYDCSSAELDELASIAEGLGAFGFRLTGAGWGGYGIALVTAGTEEAFIQGMYEQFYDPKRQLLSHTYHCFASAPCRGACIFDPECTPEIS